MAIPSEEIFNSGTVISLVKIMCQWLVTQLIVPTIWPLIQG